jgi:hypothetical protein
MREKLIKRLTQQREKVRENYTINLERQRN